LIVANDGRTAGNADLAPTDESGARQSVRITVPRGAPSDSGEPVDVAFEPAPGPPPPTAPPTISATTRPATTTTRATTTTTRPTTATTRAPIPPGTLPPIKDPNSRTIVKTGPAVIFLVHGMSDRITGSPEAEDVPNCNGPLNTPFYSRCEWGTDFIPGLFGTNSTNAGTLFNLAGRDVSGARYLNDASNHPLINEDVGLTARDANGCLTGAPAEERYDVGAAQHFVTAPKPTPGRPPQLSVFTTWRDSTRGVVESGQRIARQAYAALRWYEEQYDVAPRVYFLAQSFGGLATRFLLSNPPRAVFDTPLLNADRINVCPGDRNKMDYLRDRTVLVNTLATPHEGSYMSEWGEPPKEFLRAALDDLDRGLERNVLVRVLRALEATFPERQPVLRLVDDAHDAITTLLRLLDSPSLRDMKLNTMAAFNRGPLSPERARRSLRSPIARAGGTLIPIYATLGRSPGGNAFNSPEIGRGFDAYNTETAKERKWIFDTMFLADVLVKQFIPGGYGRVNVAPYAAHTHLLDRRARLYDLSDRIQTAKEVVAAAAGGILGQLSPYFPGEFGAGIDGIITYLSAPTRGGFLSNAVLPISVDRVWRIALSGSADVPVVQLSCGGQNIVLDYTPLVSALLLAFNGTDAVLDAVKDGSLSKLIEAAGGVIADGASLTVDTITWLQGKLTQLSNLPEQCRLPTGEISVTNFFRVVNIANWTVSGGTTSIPAPAWERTTTVARDGEMDNDGPVHAASALGFTLGTQTPLFFEHDREDGPVVNGQRTRGSWYRLPDNPVTEKYNHGMLYQNDVGQWFRQRLLRVDVGPVPQRTGDSAWP
jgi:hypothetical protein